MIQYASMTDALTKTTTSNVSNPASWLLSAMGGEPVTAGVAVTPQTALTCAAVLAAVSILCQDVAKLPLLVYKRLSGGGSEPARNHWLYPLLAKRPNPYQSRFSFREQGQAHLLLRGNSYIYKATNERGRVQALVPLHPDSTQVMVNDGELFFQSYRSPNTPEAWFLRNEPAILDQSKVVMTPGLSLDGVIGVSVIAYARETIGLAIAAERYGAKLFAQGARPSGTLTHPGKLTPEGAERLSESWNTAYSGIGNAGKVAVLEEGMKFEALALSSEDAQYIASRGFSIIEIARIFRVPPHKLMDLGRATWANIESMSMEYLTDSLVPWLERWEASLEDGLLSDKERDDYFIQHDVTRLERADSAARTALVKEMFYSGALTPNEVRSMEGRNPVPGGNVRYIPTNMAPLDEAGMPIPTQAAANANTPTQSPADRERDHGPQRPA